MAFLMPLLLILIFGYALSLDVDNVSIVVVDHDKTALSRDFLTKINASRYFNITARPESSSMASEYLDDGAATLAIIIPPGWTEMVKSDKDAPVQLLLEE